MTEPDVQVQLQALARALDQRGSAVSAAEAVARRPGRQQRTSRRLAGAAALAAVVIAAGAIVWDRDDSGGPGEKVVTTSPRPTGSTTAPAGTDDLGWDWERLPPFGFAVQSLDGPLVLYDLDGSDVGRAEHLEGVNGPRLTVDLEQVLEDRSAVSGSQEGCSATETGGGRLVALCGGEPGRPTRIDVLDSAGSTTASIDGLPIPSGSTEEVLGHWRWATPSSGGRWVVAQWSGECEIPRGFLIDVDSGLARPVTGETIDHWADAPASFVLGWAPDGRAVVHLPEAACGPSAEKTGTYLLDPSTGQLGLILPAGTMSDQVFVWTKQLDERSALGPGLWPETANSQLPLEEPDWSADPEQTALVFAQSVLGWDDATVQDAEPSEDGRFGTTLRVSSPSRDGSASVSVARTTTGGHRIYRVDSRSGEADERTASVSVQGTTAFASASPSPGAATAARVRFDYGGVVTEGPAGEAFQLKAPATTTGSVLVLFLDEAGEVVGAWGTQLPEGDFAAG